MSFLVRTQFDGHLIDGRRLYFKGGGGGGAYYGSLNKLYQEQADSARLLRTQAEANLPGAVQNYVGQVQAVTDPSYAGTQAALTGADMASANAAERAATERNLASMGVNPNDPRFAASMRGVQVSNAARMAAGKNMARNDAKKYQLAVAQDAVGTFTGQSNSAASQMGRASSGLANLAGQQTAAKQQEEAQQSANVSNAVGGAMALWSMFKDGGTVRGRGLRTLERHMLGGVAGTQQATPRGFFQTQQVAPPPAMPTRQPPQGPNMGLIIEGAKSVGETGSIAERMAARGAANTDKIGWLAGKFSPEAGNQIQSHAAGMRMAGDPTQARAASDAYRAAAAETKDAALARSYETSAANIDVGAGAQAAAPASEAVIQPVGQAAAETVATGAAGQATAQAATTAATDAAAGAASSAVTGAAGSAAASTGLGAAMGAIGTAMPWVGAAYAVGSLLGAWKDGGEIEAPSDEFSRAFNSHNELTEMGNAKP